MARIAKRYANNLLITILFFTVGALSDTVSKRKCGLPEDISIFPDFAQDEIRAVWKDYVPGTKCDKELLITDDILAVLEMFDKELEPKKSKASATEVNGNVHGIENDDKSPTRADSDYVDAREKSLNVAKKRKDIPPSEPVNVQPFGAKLVKPATHPPSIPPLSATQARATRPPASEFERPIAPTIPDPPVNEFDNDGGNANVDSGQNGALSEYGRPNTVVKKTSGVSWRVKSSRRENSDYFEPSDASQKTPKKFGDTKIKAGGGGVEEEDKPHRFGIIRNTHQYDPDYVNPPTDGSDKSTRPSAPSKSRTNEDSINTKSPIRDYNYDSTDNTRDELSGGENKKQLDDNLSFLRGADEDVSQIFNEVLNDPDLPSENRRMEELHLLAVSYLTERQLKAFDVWATRNRKRLQDGERGSAYRDDAQAANNNSGRRRERGGASKLSPDARKALSALTHDVVVSEANRRAQVLQLQPKVRSELREFSRSLLARKLS